MVLHLGWLYTPGWAELIALILGGGVLLAFVLRQLVKWSAVDERKRIELVLQAYTFKILHHYIDNKQLPSITELKEMQRQAIEHPPETWEFVSQKAVELWRKANQGKADINLRKLVIRMLRLSVANSCLCRDWRVKESTTMATPTIRFQGRADVDLWRFLRCLAGETGVTSMQIVIVPELR